MFKIVWNSRMGSRFSFGKSYEERYRNQMEDLVRSGHVRRTSNVTQEIQARKESEVQQAQEEREALQARQALQAQNKKDINARQVSIEEGKKFLNDHDANRERRRAQREREGLGGGGKRRSSRKSTRRTKKRCGTKRQVR